MSPRHARPAQPAAEPAPPAERRRRFRMSTVTSTVIGVAAAVLIPAVLITTAPGNTSTSTSTVAAPTTSSPPTTAPPPVPVPTPTANTEPAPYVHDAESRALTASMLAWFDDLAAVGLLITADNDGRLLDALGASCADPTELTAEIDAAFPELSTDELDDVVLTAWGACPPVEPSK